MLNCRSRGIASSIVIIAPRPKKRSRSIVIRTTVGEAGRTEAADSAAATRYVLVETGSAQRPVSIQHD